MYLDQQETGGGPPLDLVLLEILGQICVEGMKVRELGLIEIQQQSSNFKKAELQRKELKDLSDELRKKLFPGIKTSDDAMSRLEALQTFKAIELCITTRQIGFGTVQIFMALRQFNNVPVEGNIYQMYRVNLALLHVKMMITQRGVVALQTGQIYYAEVVPDEQTIAVVKPLVLVPDQISAVINAVGQVKTNDALYVPKYGRANRTRNGEFIPQSEQVTFANLREVVESLANVNTPAQYRRRFWRNCPIPGCRWRNVPADPILVKLQMQRNNIRGFANRRPNFRGRSSRGRGNYNDNRVVAHRKQMSAVTEKDLSDELRKKLFPGIKTSDDAMSRLEALQTFKAIELCITTRQIGFGTVQIFMALRQFNNVPVEGNIYQMYRVNLALLHVKMMITQRGVVALQTGQIYYAEVVPDEQTIAVVKPLVLVPDQISAVINAVGQVKTNDALYVPKYGRANRTRNGEFIPQSEQVTFANLREVVESLANDGHMRETIPKTPINNFSLGAPPPEEYTKQKMRET
ncbi:hypothetical protein JTB14_019741 [Gonioctena quinquepunctata]|nr:hypothetical protein JTB14_019741 [Gonioctena quinquepunctata]